MKKLRMMFISLKNSKMDNIEGRKIKKERPPLQFKLQISLEEYSRIIESFDFKEVTVRPYIYFDTSDSSKEAELFDNNIRLRIKMKDTEYFLELKKRDEETYELRDILSEEQYNLMLKGVFPEGEIKRKLIENGLFHPVKVVGSTETVRHKGDFHNGKIIVDKTTNKETGKSSYTIEFRSKYDLLKEELDSIVTKELGVANNPVVKNKLGRFWEDKS